MDSDKKFFVTTPIYYVTAKPHLGSLYSTLLADVATRWNKLRGAKTYFLTGTDEHGQKVAEAAFKANKQPKAFVDTFIDSYKEMWHKYHIEYTHFIRTTDESHVKAVQEWIIRLQKKGDIYKSVYQGYYCTPCETYVTEKEITKDLKSEIPLCSSCNRETVFVSEESYFFRLSNYQNKLLKFYEENPDFIVPNERSSEVINFVKSGLKDLSISRTTVTWGIPFPGDSKHVTYVWADALNNYITAIGFGNSAREKEFNFWWPADMQVMGKDIIRFHAVYWPAFLMASDIALPKKLLVHGWLKVNNQKMSKSFGNVIDPQTLLDTYGPEPVRYYLTRHMAITQDSEFSIQDLEQRINSDLANDLGNLLNRMVTLSDKRGFLEVKSPQNWSVAELALRDNFWNKLELIMLEMEEGYFYRGLNSVWKFISDVNAYFHAQEPWKIKDNARFEEVISATAHSLYAVGLLIWPVMPEKSGILLASLGVDILNLLKPDSENNLIDLIGQLSDNPWNRTFMLNKKDNLFEKIQKEEIQENLTNNLNSKSKEQAKPNSDSGLKSGINTSPKLDSELSNNLESNFSGQTNSLSKNSGSDNQVNSGQVARTGQAESEKDKAEKAQIKQIGKADISSDIIPDITPDITIDDFVKTMLLVGKIEDCQELEKSEKLLKLTVDFGSFGKRQILSGIKKHFTCQDLINKQAVFVYNLAPRKMMGLESHGMLLTSQDESGKLYLVTPAGPVDTVPNGTRLK